MYRPSPALRIPEQHILRIREGEPSLQFLRGGGLMSPCAIPEILGQEPEEAGPNRPGRGAGVQQHTRMVRGQDPPPTPPPRGPTAQHFFLCGRH